MGQRAGCSLAQPLANSTPQERRQGAVLATSGGSICCMALMWDDAGAALLLRLQQAMMLQLQHAAGLNPAAFRSAVLEGVPILLLYTCKSGMLHQSTDKTSSHGPQQP